MSRTRKTVDPIATPMPSAPDSEASALGAILAKPSLLEGLDLTSTHFHEPKHEMVFRAMLTLFKRGESASLVNVNAELVRLGKTDEVSPVFTAGLAARQEPAYDLPVHVAILKSMAQTRTARTAALDLLVATDNGTCNSEALDRAVKALTDVRPSQAAGHRFQILSGDDILNLPRAQWRVKGILPEAGLVVIYGPSKAGKSFLTLELATAIAQGREWFGYKTLAASVLYINLESNWGLQGRLTAWQQVNGGLPAELQFITESFNLQDADHVKGIIQAAPKNGVIIIDTLNRASPGMDENSSRDMSLLIAAAGDIQRGTGGLVILVSHTGKDTKKGIRGHSSLFAALDACIEVDQGADGSRTVRLPKVKEGADGACYRFELTQVVIGRDADGEDVTSCVVEPGEAQRKSDRPLTPALQYAWDSFQVACAEEDSDSVHLEVWRQAFYAGHTGETVNAKKKAFQRGRDGLVRIGRVLVINDTYNGSVRVNTGSGPGCPGGHFKWVGTGHTPLGVTRPTRCPGPGKEEEENLGEEGNFAEKTNAEVAPFPLEASGAVLCINGCPDWRDGPTWTVGMCARSGRSLTRKSRCDLAGCGATADGVI